MLFINVYLPSSSSKDANFISEATLNVISGYLFFTPHTLLFFSGDLNVNIYSPSRSAVVLNQFMANTSKNKTAETISCLCWDHANLEQYRNSTVNFLSLILNDIEIQYKTLINNSDCHYHPLDELCALCIQRKSETHACIDKWYDGLVYACSKTTTDSVPKL